MEKIKSMDKYQKGILLFMAAMVLVYTAIYPLTIARTGYMYKNSILVPSQKNGCTVYSGKIQGIWASFTVSADRTVEFQYDNKTYGPYTAKEDPATIPKDAELRELMTGVELRCGKEVRFRGAMIKNGSELWLFNEDGDMEISVLSVMASNGMLMDENGNVIDPMEPSVSTILELMDSPELSHRGDWRAWFAGVFFCILNGLSIFFADELFRWSLHFRIQDAEWAEPSYWEIAGRYISWFLFPIVALIFFIAGLQ